MERSQLFGMALACLLLLSACGDRLRPARNPGELAFHLELSGKLEIQVPDGILREHVLHVVRDLQGYDVRVLRPGERGASTAGRILLGTLESPDVRELCEGAGVEPIDGGFRWLERDYTESTDALVLTFEDPVRRGLPVTVYLGNDSEQLTAYVERIQPAARPSASSYVRGELERSTRLSLTGEAYASELVDHELGRRKLLGKLTYNLQTKSNVRFNAPTETDRTRDYAADVERAAGLAREWLGGRASAPVRLTVIVDSMRMAEMHGTLETHFFNRVLCSVRALVADGLPDDAGFGAARAKAVQLAGAAADEWFEEALALDAAGEWWGVPLDSWVAHLSSGDILSPDQLIDPEIAARRSPHRVRPFQAMLVRYLRETRGLEVLRDAWRTGMYDLPSESDFELWLQTQLADVRPPERNPARPLGVHGICFSESRSVGYASREAGRSLRELAAVGADAVSISSFAAREAHLIGAAELRDDRVMEAVEGDLALASLLLRARQLELSTILRPHVLVSPSGSWSGAQVLTSESDWAHYYDELGAYLDHYGLLAELCEVDLLVLGSELPEVTSTKTDVSEWDPPDLENWKRRGLKELVADVRRSFRGPLTYASMWSFETEEIEFWDQLDYVGCTLFRSFRHPEDPWLPPTFNRVRQATHKRVSDMVAFARERSKPLLLLDFGVPSTEFGWRFPRIADGAVDPDTQALVLSAMGDALVEVAESSPELAGVHLWNWWTDPDAGGSFDRGWSIQNKPALAEVQRFFGRL